MSAQGYQGYDAGAMGEDYSAGYEAHGGRNAGAAGGFPKKRLLPSEPSPHVIFLGLDPDFTEADVCIHQCTPLWPTLNSLAAPSIPIV